MNTWEKEPECSLEEGIRHGDYHPLDLAQSPWSLPGIPGRDCIAVRNTAFLKLPNTRSGVLPLLPEDGPQASHDPVMEGAEAIGTLRDAVIIPPPAQK